MILIIKKIKITTITTITTIITIIIMICLSLFPLVQRIDLYNFANLLLKLGLVNAINLDGGGSATMVINNTVINYPSDEW